MVPRADAAPNQNIENNPMQSSRRFVGITFFDFQKLLDASGKSPALLQYRGIERVAPHPGGGFGTPDQIFSSTGTSSGLTPASDRPLTNHSRICPMPRL